jgi:hypothetical protein
VVATQGGATVATASAAVANDTATVTLPALAAGTYDYTLSYAGDEQIAAFAETGSLTVTPADDPPAGADPPVVAPPAQTPAIVPSPPASPVTSVVKRKVTGAVTKVPTSRKAGKYKVRITGIGKAKVKVKLKKGSKTKTLTGTLKNGVVTLSVPKLAKGTWKVTISWPGGSATGASIKVKK